MGAAVSAPARNTGPRGQGMSPSALFRVRRGENNFVFPAQLSSGAIAPAPMLAPGAQSPEFSTAHTYLFPLQRNALNLGTNFQGFEMVNPFELYGDSTFPAGEFLENFPTQAEVMIESGMSMPNSTSNVIALPMIRHEGDSLKKALVRIQVQSALWNFATERYSRHSNLALKTGSAPKALQDDWKLIEAFSAEIVNDIFKTEGSESYRYSIWSMVLFSPEQGSVGTDQNTSLSELFRRIRTSVIDNQVSANRMERSSENLFDKITKVEKRGTSRLFDQSSQIPKNPAGEIEDDQAPEDDVEPIGDPQIEDSDPIGDDVDRVDGIEAPSKNVVFEIIETPGERRTEDEAVDPGLDQPTIYADDALSDDIKDKLEDLLAESEINGTLNSETLEAKLTEVQADATFSKEENQAEILATIRNLAKIQVGEESLLVVLGRIDDIEIEDWIVGLTLTQRGFLANLRGLGPDRVFDGRDISVAQLPAGIPNSPLKDHLARLGVDWILGLVGEDRPFNLARFTESLVNSQLEALGLTDHPIINHLNHETTLFERTPEQEEEARRIDAQPGRQGIDVVPKHFREWFEAQVFTDADPIDRASYSSDIEYQIAVHQDHLKRYEGLLELLEREIPNQDHPYVRIMIAFVRVRIIGARMALRDRGGEVGNQFDDMRTLVLVRHEMRNNQDIFENDQLKIIARFIESKIYNLIRNFDWTEDNFIVRLFHEPPEGFTSGRDDVPVAALWGDRVLTFVHGELKQGYGSDEGQLEDDILLLAALDHLKENAKAYASGSPELNGIDAIQKIFELTDVQGIYITPSNILDLIDEFRADIANLLVIRQIDRLFREFYLRESDVQQALVRQRLDELNKLLVLSGREEIEADGAIDIEAILAIRVEILGDVKADITAQVEAVIADIEAYLATTDERFQALAEAIQILNNKLDEIGEGKRRIRFDVEAYRRTPDIDDLENFEYALRNLVRFANGNPELEPLTNEVNRCLEELNLSRDLTQRLSDASRRAARFGFNPDRNPYLSSNDTDQITKALSDLKSKLDTFRNQEVEMIPTGIEDHSLDPIEGMEARLDIYELMLDQVARLKGRGGDQEPFTHVSVFMLRTLEDVAIRFHELIGPDYEVTDRERDLARRYTQLLNRTRQVLEDGRKVTPSVRAAQAVLSSLGQFSPQIVLGARHLEIELDLVNEIGQILTRSELTGQLIAWVMDHAVVGSELTRHHDVNENGDVILDEYRRPATDGYYEVEVYPLGVGDQSQAGAFMWPPFPRLDEQLEFILSFGDIQIETERLENGNYRLRIRFVGPTLVNPLLDSDLVAPRQDRPVDRFLENCELTGQDFLDQFVRIVGNEGQVLSHRTLASVAERVSPDDLAVGYYDAAQALLESEDDYLTSDELRERDPGRLAVHPMDYYPSLVNRITESHKAARRFTALAFLQRSAELSMRIARRSSGDQRIRHFERARDAYARMYFYGEGNEAIQDRAIEGYVDSWVGAAPSYREQQRSLREALGGRVPLPAHVYADLAMRTGERFDRMNQPQNAMVAFGLAQFYYNEAGIPNLALQAHRNYRGSWNDGLIAAERGDQNVVGDMIANLYIYGLGYDQTMLEALLRADIHPEHQPTLRDVCETYIEDAMIVWEEEDYANRGERVVRDFARFIATLHELRIQDIAINGGETEVQYHNTPLYIANNAGDAHMARDLLGVLDGMYDDQVVRGEDGTILIDTQSPQEIYEGIFTDTPPLTLGGAIHPFWQAFGNLVNWNIELLPDDFTVRITFPQDQENVDGSGGDNRDTFDEQDTFDGEQGHLIKPFIPIKPSLLIDEAFAQFMPNHQNYGRFIFSGGQFMMG